MKKSEDVHWLEYCKSCKKKHYVMNQPCPDCGVHRIDYVYWDSAWFCQANQGCSKPKNKKK